MDAKSLAPHWLDAADVILGDPDGDDLEVSGAAWARAVEAEVQSSGARVTCSPDLFAPLAVGGVGAFVVNRSMVHVTPADVPGLLEACRAAWQRWWCVDDDGQEHQEPLDDVDPFGDPRRTGAGYLLAYDSREVEDPLPLKAARCLVVLLDELRRHGCEGVHLEDAT